MSARGAIALAALAVAVSAAFASLALPFGELFSAEGLAQMGRYGAAFFPPDLSADMLGRVGDGALETLAISAVGTALACALGLLLAVPAAGRLGWMARIASRLLLNFLRSVPELVWAALLVIGAGLGPFPGTLALAVHTAGVLGRLFAETLENAPSEPARALVLAGAPAPVAFLYGTLPSVLPQLAAYSLYRWEINIRMAAILGFVGAGGLGQMLHVSLSLFQQPQAATLILAMLGLVSLVDGASAWVRGRLIPSGH